MVAPYLPDIFEGIVKRVSDAFSARSIDPFAVFFDKGIQKQAGKSIYQKTKDGIQTWPLIWLMMPFPENRGDDYTIFAKATCSVLIIMPTDGKYSQQQRDDLTFKPRLIPIYDVVMQEISRERWFVFQGPGKISHTRILRPYWGGSDVEGPNQVNLFKKEVDAILIQNLQVKIQLENCNTNAYPLNKNTNYPTLP